MEDTLVRTVLWNGLWLPGAEWCQLARQGDGWRLVGTALLALAGAPAQVRYDIAIDADWATREVTVAVRSGDGAPERHLRLTVAEGQRWRVQRQPAAPRDATGDEIPALRGLVDVDLGFTPATNTLPIHRLAPAVGEAVEVAAVWVRFPELSVEPLPQRYVRLGARQYRYESAGGAFVAALEVDDLGLVVTYEGGWQRIAVADRSPGSVSKGGFV
jgi:hypothetical protein